MKISAMKRVDGIPDCDLCFDWKATPFEVVEAVNKLLVQREIDAEFVSHNVGGDSDMYLLKQRPAGWARLSVTERNRAK